MYNSNWEANQDIITGLELYRVSNVIKYLHHLRDFILVTAGKLSDSRVPVLKPDYMPSKNSRFPEDELYLCEGFGEWSQYHHDLLLCVSAMLNQNRLVRGYTQYSTAGQTEETVLELVGKIFQVIYSNSICMDRGVFETHYCLEWYTPESPQPILGNQNSFGKLIEKTKSSSNKSNGDLGKEEDSEDGDIKDNEGPSI